MPKFGIGQVVAVNGELYSGDAEVRATWDANGVPNPYNASKAEVRSRQSFPQVSVVTPAGKKLHYNGDDIASGVISPKVFAIAGTPTAPAVPAASVVQEFPTGAVARLSITPEGGLSIDLR